MSRIAQGVLLVAGLLVAYAGAFEPDREIAAGKFLVASTYWMRDPLFRSSVILLLHHDSKKGTLGVILNHPTKMTVQDAVPEVKSPAHRASPVYLGGPVSPKLLLLLVRSSQRTDEVVYVMKDVSFTSNEDTLRELLSGEARRNRIRLFAGYSGWGPGQLEAEMQVGAWQLLPADAATVFDMDPAQLWPELSNRKPPLQTMRRAPRQPYRPAPDVLSTSR